MIEIIVQKEKMLYNVYHLVKAFYPSEELQTRVEEKASTFVGVFFEEGASFLSDTEVKKDLDQELYQFLSDKTKRVLDWGVLQGVRPSKLAMKKVEEGMEKSDFITHIGKERLVSKQKAELIYEIAKRERQIMKPLDLKRGWSLYVGIPFCPSVCTYCSFSSGSVKEYEAYIEDYVDALCMEIRSLKEVVKERKLNTIYIGGGTPTSLTAEQLEKLCRCIEDTFSFEDLLEYTVEAGRPDSITKAKLEVLKRFKVSRISINPQSMQQKTLDIIGRNHSIESVNETFYLAREVGFDNINMDLIMGLPGEGVEEARDTLEKIKTLGPESLTIHSLAIKRVAQLTKQEIDGKTVEKMLELGREYASVMGLRPYYLYRQKNIAGNFENTGYAKVDKEGLYNILIMEEKQTILACGAGATSKIVLEKEKDNLIRIGNVKNIREYITRIEQIVKGKGDIQWH